MTQLSKENLLFFPGEMIVVTSDPGSVKSQYITLNPEAFLKIKSNSVNTIVDTINETLRVLYKSFRSLDWANLK